MKSDRGIDLRLAAGFALSLLAHAMIALAIGADVFPASHTTPPPPPPTMDKPEITPGVDNSHTTTINWIGFEKPTPHQARLAATDQPALTRGPDPTPSTQRPPSSLAPVVKILTPTPTQPSAASTPAAASPAQAQSPNDQPTQTESPSPNKIELSKPTPDPSRKKSAQPPKPSTKPTAKPKPQPTTKPTPQSTPRPTPKPTLVQAPPKPPSTKGGGKRESPATSQKKPITVKPGQPIAMKGLRIDTIAPKFSTLTRLTSAPGNPLVELTFNTLGKVTHAEVLESSGYEDVDRPVKDALYHWRAHGKQLDTLKKTDPKQKFTLQFRIVLQ